MKRLRKTVATLVCSLAILGTLGAGQVKAATYYPCGADEWDCGADYNASGRYEYSNYINYVKVHRATAMRNGVYAYAPWTSANYWANADTSPNWHSTTSSGAWYANK